MKNAVLVATALVLGAAGAHAGGEAGTPPGAPPLAPDTLAITLAPAVRVAGLEILLEDVASVAGGTPEERAALARVVLGAAPVPGERVDLSRAFVLDRLVGRGWGRERVKLGGAPRTAVTPLTTVVSARDLVEQGLAALRRELEGRVAPHRLEIEPGVTPASPVVPAGRAGIRTQLRVRSAAPASGPTYVDAAILVDGRPVRMLGLPYHVRVVGRVLVASRPIRRDEPLGPGNLTLIEREIPRLGGSTALPGFEAVEGRLARRPVRAGEILTSAAVYRPYSVRRGDSVVLVLRDGPLTLSTRGTAAADGYAGQEIPVRNDHSGQTVFGRITAGKTVEVAPRGRSPKKGTNR